VHRVVGSGGRRALEDQAHPALVEPAVLDAQEGVAPDELALVEADEAVEAEMERRDVRRDVLAVQRQRLLDAQALHGERAVGLESQLAAAGQEHVQTVPTSSAGT
jgi:hypothetical protein